jgi:hypothetical protein
MRYSDAVVAPTVLPSVKASEARPGLPAFTPRTACRPGELALAFTDDKIVGATRIHSGSPLADSLGCHNVSGAPDS